MWENWDKLLHEIVIIKWGVVCLVFMSGARISYWLVKGLVKMWKKQDPKNNLHNLPDGGCEGGHY